MKRLFANILGFFAGLNSRTKKKHIYILALWGNKKVIKICTNLYKYMTFCDQTKWQKKLRLPDTVFPKCWLCVPYFETLQQKTYCNYLRQNRRLELSTLIKSQPQGLTYSGEARLCFCHWGQYWLSCIFYQSRPPKMDLRLRTLFVRPCTLCLPGHNMS